MTPASRTRRTLLVATTVVAFLLLASSAAAAFDIRLTDEGFDPDSVTVAPGEDVLWVNDSGEEQTIVAEDGSWDSGPLAPGETFSVSLRDQRTVAYGTEDGLHLAELVVREEEDEPREAPRAEAPAMPLTGHPTPRSALLAVALLSAGGALVLGAARRGPPARRGPRAGR